MFILNISRIFLSPHGNVDVIVGTVDHCSPSSSVRRCSSASPTMRVFVARRSCAGGFVVDAR